MRTMRREEWHVHCHPSKHLMKNQHATFIPFYLKLIYIQPILTILWMVKA